MVPNYYQVVRQIDLYLATELTPAVIEQVLGLVAEGPEYASYFLQTATSPEWLLPLKERNYFSPQKAPGAKEGEEKGSFWFPQWNALLYLETLSKQVGEPGKEVYLREVLDVIREVSKYHIDHERVLDNYRTWWYFVKILLNLPSQAIPQDIIDLVPVWLDSKFDSSLPGSEIARKLLPKFLDSKDSQDHKKAEKMVETITTVRCKEMPEDRRKGLFGREQEAETLVDSYWLEESFKANGKKVGERCSEKVLLCMADRLKQVFRCEEPEHEFKFKHEEKEYAIVARHEHDFEFLCEVHLMLYEKDKDRTLEQKVLDGVEFQTEKIHEFPIHDCRDRTTFVETMAGRVREKTTLGKLDSDLEEKMGYFYEGILSDYSYIWFPSINSGPELSVHGAKETLAVLLRDTLQAKANADPAGAKTVLTAFRSARYQYPLFKRMVIFTIAQKWDAFSGEFDSILKEENADELFDNSYYEYEISQLFTKHVGKLTPPQKERITEIIEAGPTGWRPDQNQQQYVDRWKQKWYSVLKSDPLFGELHDKQVQVTGVKEELPTKPVHFESRLGPGRSPLTKDELLAKPNADLVSFLLSFKTEDAWKGPSVEGLAEALRVTAESDPNKFVSDLMPFVDVGYTYVYYLLLGLRSAWSQKKSIDWDKLLDFLWTYTDREPFWNDQFTVQDDELKANHTWVTGMIGEFIREGTRDDAWAFPDKLLPLAKRLLFLVFDKEKPPGHPAGDAVTYALNSVHGKAITALVFLALRTARVQQKEAKTSDQKWAWDVKARYDALLGDRVVEAYTFLGHYMPNLYYLDARWMRERIREMSEEPKAGLWAAFMEGYLLGARLYTDLYELMKPNYERGLTHSFADDHVRRRLVEHIAWRYLDDVERLEDPHGLFQKMMDLWDSAQIQKVIQFFWGRRDHLTRKVPAEVPAHQLPPEIAKQRARIMEFWKTVCDRYKGKPENELSDEDRTILGSLSTLTVFLSEIDSQTVDWLILSVPYTRMSFHAPFFVEYLDDLKDADDETTKHVGQLLRKLAETSAPDYPQEHIQSIVQHLYATGEKENIQNANDICNIYGSKSLHFLRDLWEKHNPLP